MVPSAILSQYLHFNTIKTEHTFVYYEDYSDNHMNCMSNFFDKNIKLEPWLNNYVQIQNPKGFVL